MDISVGRWMDILVGWGAVNGKRRGNVGTPHRRLYGV